MLVVIQDCLVQFSAILADTQAPYDIILGSDFLDYHGAIIDTTQHQLCLALTVIPLLPECTTVLEPGEQTQISFSPFLPPETVLNTAINRSAIAWHVDIDNRHRLTHRPHPHRLTFYNSSTKIYVVNQSLRTRIFPAHRPVLYLDIRSKFPENFCVFAERIYALDHETKTYR